MISSTQPGRRIVVTGLGLFSPIGIGREAFWQSLAEGKSGLHKREPSTIPAAPESVGGAIPEFNDKSARTTYLSDLKKSLKVMCREIQMGVASAVQAIADARLDLAAINHERLGVEFGANLMFTPPDQLTDACNACVEPPPNFHFDRWGTSGLGNMEPLWLLRYLPNMPACHIGIYADARGPNNSLTLDEASGCLVLGEAFRIMQRDAADMMVVGTTGTRIHPIKSMHAALWDQLASSSDPPETWYRPFDATRSGQVVSEGAGSLLLEEENHARSRGASILGEILGAGASCVTARSGSPPIRTALANAMRSALKSAGIAPGDVGHINAHGLGTTSTDVDEAAAIHDVFGPDASRVPVTALKSYLGNSGAGCGILEIAGSFLALSHGVVPATLNYKTPDPACALNVVHGQPVPVSNKVFLKVNVTRAGQASAIVARGL